jgi:hypothetical protein
MAEFTAPAAIDYRPDNTIIFTIARMNPPTPGHLFLVQKLIDKAIALNVDEVYIILSKSNDDNENPILCEEKQIMLGKIDDVSKTMINALKQRMIAETPAAEKQRQIQNIRVNTICSSNMFAPLMQLINDRAGVPDINLIVFMGEDRKDFIDSIARFFVIDEKQSWPMVNSIMGIDLMREDMDMYKGISKDPAKLRDLDMTTVPVNAMSASFVRNIVKNKNKEKFTALYSPYLDQEKIDLLYPSIQAGLAKPEPKPKPKGVNKLNYTYPMIKGSVSGTAATAATASKTPKVASVNAGKTPRVKKELQLVLEEELRSKTGTSTSRSKTSRTGAKGGGKRVSKKKTLKRNKRKSKKSRSRKTKRRSHKRKL